MSHRAGSCSLRFLTSSSLLCLPVLLGGGVAAQTQRVVPASAALEDQVTSSSFPFTFTATRTQQLWDAQVITANSAIITALAYRQEAKGAAYAGRPIPYLVVSLGHSPLTAATMSTTFAANFTGQLTAVSAASYNLPSLPPARGVASFAIALPFSVPFSYVTAMGNLLVEVIAPGFASQNGEYLLDAVLTPATGFSEEYGPKPKWVHSMGGSVFNGELFIDVGLLRPVPPPAVSFILGASASWFGATPLPLDLTPFGAPGNLLHTVPQVVVPFSLSRAGVELLVGGTSIPLPPILPPGGVVHAQVVLTDPTANALGLELSNGLAVQVGGATPFTQIVATSKATAATGVFPLGFFKPGGPVVQLTGTFQ